MARASHSSDAVVRVLQRPLQVLLDKVLPQLTAVVPFGRHPTGLQPVPARTSRGLMRRGPHSPILLRQLAGGAPAISR